jgi:hypothetical protein
MPSCWNRSLVAFAVLRHILHESSGVCNRIDHHVDQIFSGLRHIAAKEAGGKAGGGTGHVSEVLAGAELGDWCGSHEGDEGGDDDELHGDGAESLI